MLIWWAAYYFGEGPQYYEVCEVEVCELDIFKDILGQLSVVSVMTHIFDRKFSSSVCCDKSVFLPQCISRFVWDPKTDILSQNIIFSRP